MGAVTYIVIGVVALIVALAGFKLVRDKRRGVKCAGCPSANGCRPDGPMPCGTCSYRPDDE